MRFNRKSRKGLFLSTTLSRGVRLKDDNEGGGATSGDDIEVGPGFAAAADAQASDDNRTPEQRGGASQDLDEAGDNQGDADGEGDGEGEGDEQKEPPKKKNRETAAYIRDIKREAREAKAAAAALEARLAALEKGGLPNSNSGGNSSDTSGKPDPTDAAKYPLGVLDDGYTADLIEWTAEQKVATALASIQQKAQASETEAQEQQKLSDLRAKMDAMTDKGSELFDDFEEEVVEAGLRGDWKLSETTFTAAAEAEHGAEILHFLATNKAEAARVHALSPFQQMKFVLDKDAEIGGKKPKPRTIPRAGNPPSDLPRGRNSSAPIRADTDNLDDFRKLFYQK